MFFWSLYFPLLYNIYTRFFELVSLHIHSTGELSEQWKQNCMGVKDVCRELYYPVMNDYKNPS